MKILFIVFTVTLCSCRYFDDTAEYTEDGKLIRPIYRPKMYAMSDSFNKYIEQSNCLFKCGKRDSSDLLWKVASAYMDSQNYYYALIYPNGNPANNPTPPKENKPNCNCQ